MPDIILPHGKYQGLESYQNSVVIYDATCDFCTLFLRKGDRTIDQMVQAARSGKQNIIEGSEASAISTGTELKLIGVARASLEELLEDYRDYLRTHRLDLWSKEDSRVLAIRQFVWQREKTYAAYKAHFQLSSQTPELFCNLLISLIHQTNYLLDRLLKKLEQDFKEKGGLRERMYNARTGYRTARTDEALKLLREIYHGLGALEQPDLQRKVEQVAALLKEGAK